MPKPADVDLVSTAILATELGVDVRTIHRMVGRGELKPYLKVPGPKGAYLFRREDLPAAKDAA